jgi:hypothetical protein
VSGPPPALLDELLVAGADGLAVLGRSIGRGERDPQLRLVAGHGAAVPAWTARPAVSGTVMLDRVGSGTSVKAIVTARGARPTVAPLAGSELRTTACAPAAAALISSLSTPSV